MNSLSHRALAAFSLCASACSPAPRPAPAPVAPPETASAVSPPEPTPMPSSSSTSNAAQATDANRKTGGRYTMQAPPRKVEVVADTGARITEFSLDGHNVFATPEDHAFSYGVTFWPSPQKAWGWPPPEEIDVGPYSGALEANVLTLASAPSPRVGLTLTKTIRLDATTGALHVDYAMKNVKDSLVSFAPWENARVRGGGVTFFPINGQPAKQSSLKLDVRNGIAWLAHSPERFKKGGKAFADGKEGWLAHSDGKLVVIFEFEDVPADAQAADEGEIEIYADSSGKFVEVEHQGRFGAIQPSETTTWSVTWHLERVPDGVAVSAGSDALVRFVRKTLGR